MAGEFDSLRVRIESNSDKARNNIGYLVTALSDLRKITGLTNDSLRETNGLLREMRDHFKAFKSMGDPFAGFSRGAERASRNAQKFRDAMAGTADNSKTSTNAMTLWGNKSTTAIVKVKDALWDAKSAYDTLRNTVKRGFGGSLEDKNIIEGTYKERKGYNYSSPSIKSARFGDKPAENWKTSINPESVNQYLKGLAESRRLAELEARKTSDDANVFGTSAERIKALKSAFDSARQAVSKLGGAIRKAASNSKLIQTIAHPFKAVGEAINKATTRAGRFFASIKRIAVYRLIRSALKAISQGFQKGIGNLYQWSAAVGTTFAPAMDKIATDMLYLKNAFAAMFSPIIEFVQPIIRKVVDLLVGAFNWVQKVFSQLTGRDHWYKAVRVEKKYAEQTQDTTKAVKELRKEIQLMDWDEINNITDNPDTGSGNSGVKAVEPNPADMFVQVEQPLDKLEGSNFWERLWNLIKQGWENLKEWWRSVDWEELGKKVGEKIVEWWGKFKEWFGQIDWASVWAGIKEVILDLWSFIQGALRVIFPVYDKYLKTQEKVKEAQEAVVDAYNKTHGENGDSNIYYGTEGNQGSGGGFGYQNPLGYEKAIDDYNVSYRRLFRVREDINKAIQKLFTNEDGTFNEADKNLYDKIIADRTSVPGAKLFNDMMADPKFKAYVSLLGQLEGTEESLAQLERARAEAAKTAMAIQNGNVESLESYQNALKRIGPAGRAFYNTLSKKVIPAVALLATETVSHFTKADWEDGGKKAMDKLRKSLLNNGVEPAAVEIAVQAAAAFASQRGWITTGEKTSALLVEGLRNSNIPLDYQTTAFKALQGYLTYVDWENGGMTTAKGIKEAFVAAGIPEQYASESAVALSKFLNKEQSKATGRTMGLEVMTGFNGGIGLYRSEDIANTVNDKLAKAKKFFNKLGIELDVKTDGLVQKIKSVKIPTVNIPVQFSKKAIMQNVEVNVVGSNKNIIQGYKGQIQAFFRANGGYVPQGSLFVAGEVPGQAEMVGNINGKTGVVSGREISGIGDAVWSTGNNTANLLEQLIRVVQNKNLTISPSAALGQTVAKSSRLYAMQTG